MKMNPILLTVENIHPTETGKKNIQNLSDAFDCDIIKYELNDVKYVEVNLLIPQEVGPGEDIEFIIRVDPEGGTDSHDDDNSVSFELETKGVKIPEIIGLNTSTQLVRVSETLTIDYEIHNIGNIVDPNIRAKIQLQSVPQTNGVITEMYEKTRAEGFGPEVQRRVMVGTYVLSAGFYDAYYNRARKVRTLIKKDFEDVFAQGVDAILTPATPSAAFGLGEMQDADPVQMYLNDVFTVTVNLAGLPGVSVPAGLDKQGLPLGLQLIGRPWEEGDLLNTAYALEQAAGFVEKPARWW